MGRKGREQGTGEEQSSKWEPSWTEERGRGDSESGGESMRKRALSVCTPPGTGNRRVTSFTFPLVSGEEGGRGRGRVGTDSSGTHST